VRIADSALVAAATLSNRYITDRFLPDKAIDLVDEAGARLRMQVDSKPEELDSIDREIIRLKIEGEALKKEADTASRDRLARLEKELADLEEQSAQITARWNAEKSKLGAAAELKRRLDEARTELAQVRASISAPASSPTASFPISRSSSPRPRRRKTLPPPTGR